MLEKSNDLSIRRQANLLGVNMSKFKHICFYDKKQVKNYYSNLNYEQS